MLKTSSSINSYFLYKITDTLPPSLKLNVRICAEDAETLKDRGGDRERKWERESCSKQQIKRNRK